MARRAQPEPLGCGVAQRAHRRLGRRRFHPNDPRIHGGCAVVGVGVRGGTADTVVDVDSSDVVPERPERVPEARRVGTARDEARDTATRLHEPVGPDERLDACRQRRRHTPSVTEDRRS